MKGVNPIVGNWNRLSKLISFALVIVFTVFTVALLKDRLILAISFEKYPLPQFSAFLLILTMVWIIFWYFAAVSELQMLRDHFEEFLVEIPRNASVFTVLVAASVGALVIYSNNIIAFSSIFIVLQISSYWGLWTRDRILRVKFPKIRETYEADDERHKYLDAISSYYFDFPQAPFTVTAMFFGFVSLVISVIGYYNPSKQEILYSVSYGIMIVLILSGRIGYSIIRKKRDKKLIANYG